MSADVASFLFSFLFCMFFLSSFVYAYNYHFCFVFGHISSCSNLYPNCQRGWARFGRWDHVARGLGAIRAVCRAWQALLTLLALRHIEANRRVSASPIPVYASLIPVTSRTLGFDAHQEYMCKSCARTTWVTFGLFFAAAFLQLLFCTHEQSHNEHSQHAESTTLKKLAPSSTSRQDRACVSHPYTPLPVWVASWFFRGLLRICNRRPVFCCCCGRHLASLNENVKTVASSVLCHFISDINLYLFPREHTQPCVDNSENAYNTDNATTVPSSTSSSRQHHARVARPYVVYC